MESMVKIMMTVPECAFLAIKGFAEKGKFNFSYEYVKKEEILKETFDEISSRFCDSNFSIEGRKEIYNTFCITVIHPKKGIRVGIAKRNPTDIYDFDIGYYLSLSRACGWKDLEEKLLSVL